jgi:hypothetical protein
LKQNKLTIYFFTLLYALSIRVYTYAQPAWPPTDVFASSVLTCATSLNINISGDLEGSVRSLYEGVKTQGHLTSDMTTGFINSFPDAIKLEAYKVYTDCVLKLLLQGHATVSLSSTPSVFQFGNVPTKDGNGNVVGWLSGISATVREEPRPNQSILTPFVFQYDYYNGSGTWRGSQTIHLSFNGAGGAILASFDYSLDRGHCVYNHSETRSVSGILGNIKPLITNISVSVSNVSGVQTRC